MRKIYEHEIGSDGAKAGLYVEAGLLEIKASYPVVKILDIVTKPLDPLKEKLKNLIPGDWDGPLIDKAFQEAKDLMAKLLSEG